MAMNSHWWRTRPLAVVALTVALLALQPPPMASAETLCGAGVHWPMDEAPNATVMSDTAGSNPGKITGAATGVPSGHSAFNTAYRFGRGSAFPKGAQVVVPTAAELNAGMCDFAVDVWVNWDKVAPLAKATYNVTQKGLATAAANWKLEVDGRPDKGKAGFGRVICTFDGVDSRGPVRVSSQTRIQAGQWAELGCERRGDQFIVKVDTSSTAVTVSGIGAITNSRALTVGAKKLNDSDTFPGGIAGLRFSRS